MPKEAKGEKRPANVIGATTTAKRIRTQWAAQFLVASELTRRGYTVAFTMGNYTPDADLMVGAPSGNQFWIDVKGLSSKNVWPVRPKPDHPALYYVLVYLSSLADPPGVREPDRFFVLTQKDANGLLHDYRNKHPQD